MVRAKSVWGSNMATCAYCEKEISPTATVCPHCGDIDPTTSYPTPPSFSKEGSNLPEVLLGLTVAVAIVVSIFITHGWITKINPATDSFVDWLLAVAIGSFGVVLVYIIVLIDVLLLN